MVLQNSHFMNTCSFRQC